MSENRAPLMLGVSGLRGIVGQSLTPEVAARFAAALGEYLRSASPRPKQMPLVVVGRDGRAGGEAWMAAAQSGLIASGCLIADAGIVMTPTLGVLADGASAGLMVTASHNPQEWNGLKILLPDAGRRGKVSAAAPPKAMAQRLIELFNRGPSYQQDWRELGGSVVLEHAGAAHAERSSRALAEVMPLAKVRRAGFRVALDSCGGAGTRLTPGFLEDELGCRVSQCGAYDDGVFPHTPEPTRENLAGFARRVRGLKAHVGFAQDPDADRLAIIDEKGRYIGEEYTLVLAALAMGEAGLIRKGSTLAVNLSTSRMIDDVAAGFGAAVLRTPVGEANVAETMKSRKCVLGGEGNGGVIWPKVTFVRDSLSAMGLALTLMARRKQPLSAIVDAIPAYAIEKRKVEIARKEDARPAVERIAATYGAQPGTRVDLQDGVRVDWLDRRAWLHVRASNTEPIMRLIAEAPTSAAAREILNEAARIASA